MFVVESYSTAVIFCAITMLCWGSWANTQKLAGQRWRFELFYWDYVFGVLLAGPDLRLHPGQHGHGRTRLSGRSCPSRRTNLGSALLGGVIFNAANILSWQPSPSPAWRSRSRRHRPGPGPRRVSITRQTGRAIRCCCLPASPLSPRPSFSTPGPIANCPARPREPR